MEIREYFDANGDYFTYDGRTKTLCVKVINDNDCRYLARIDNFGLTKDINAMIEELTTLKIALETY